MVDDDPKIRELVRPIGRQTQARHAPITGRLRTAHSVDIAAGRRADPPRSSAAPCLYLSEAYPLPDVAEAVVVNDAVGRDSIVVLWSPGTASGLGGATVAGGDLVGSAVVYSRAVPDGATLEFERAGEGLMTDTETRSTWNVGGTAIDGPLSGTQLESVPNDQPFWFAWAIFRPDTVIWQP